METFAYIQAAVAHEDPTPDAELRSLEELGLTLSSSTLAGLFGVVLSASVLLSPLSAIAFPVTVASPTGNLNIRSGPGLSYPVIGGLGNGQTVQIARTSGGWYQLSSGGWVAGNYTAGGSSGGGGGAPVTGTPGSQFLSATAGVNIRSGPGTNYAIIGGLAAGTGVRVISSSGGWYQLSSGGWVAGNYLSGGGSSGGGGGSSFSRRNAAIATNGSPLLVRSSPNGAIVGSLANGRVIGLSGRVSGNWYEMTNGNWVSAQWIRMERE